MPALLTDLGFTVSRSEARRVITKGIVRVDGEALTEHDATLPASAVIEVVGRRQKVGVPQPDKLTTRQRDAIDLLSRYGPTDNGWGVVSLGATAVYDGQAWVNYRTALALFDRGLVQFDGSDEDSLLRLTTEGRRFVRTD